jgi:hypothetical protein
MATPNTSPGDALVFGQRRDAAFATLRPTTPEFWTREVFQAQYADLIESDDEAAGLAFDAAILRATPEPVRAYLVELPPAATTLHRSTAAMVLIAAGADFGVSAPNEPE